jgi:heterodisulfide reductase subunit C
VFWADEEYFGPAAIVNAHRFVFDSRDQGAAQRLTVLNDKEGVWRCRTTFNCTDACPRGIKVTQAIQEVSGPCCSAGSSSRRTARAVRDGSAGFERGDAEVEATASAQDPNFGGNVSVTRTRVVRLRRA